MTKCAGREFTGTEEAPNQLCCEYSEMATSCVGRVLPAPARLFSLW